MAAVRIENGLVNSYRNKISEWAEWSYENFFVPRVEEIPIPENRPIRKSYISYLYGFVEQFIGFKNITLWIMSTEKGHLTNI